MSTQVAQQQQVSTQAASSLGQTAAAMMFGVLVLFAVGFAPMDAAHNAAHDARHALAFPCH